MIKLVLVLVLSVNNRTVRKYNILLAGLPDLSTGNPATDRAVTN
jgi:hypothetical protein